MQAISEKTLQTATLDVKGMKCAGCVLAVEKQLSQNEGVNSAVVNLLAEVAVIEYSPETIAPGELADKLTDLGFPSRPRPAISLDKRRQEREEERVDSRKREKKNLIVATVLLVLSLIGHLHHLGGPDVPIIGSLTFHWLLATLALLLPGREIFIDGWRGLKHGQPNMNTLVGLGTGSAYLASCLALIFPALNWECFFDEPVMLLGFILFGRTLEARARHRAAEDLEALEALQPPLATLIGSPEAPDRGIDIPVEQIQEGDRIRVLPGEKIPVDGVIVNGSTTIDESLMTGESLPVDKNIGDGVSAGTLNLTGVIALETRGVGDDTALARIIASVENAGLRKAPVQKLADRVAGYFAYGVMTIALLVFLFWNFYGVRLFPGVLNVHHGDMMMTVSPVLLSLKLAISVLVVACPCALGLATPTAILVGTGLAAKRGILIKGGDVLEKLRELDTIVFDKTGTLTLGRPVPTDIISCSDYSDREILQLAAAVESGSNHPLARAIVAAAGTSEFRGEDFKTEAGGGVSAVINGERFYLGNRHWLEERGIAIDKQERLTSLENSGKTLIYLAKDRIIGLIALQDRLRPEAGETIAGLRSSGLKVAIVSGDRSEAVSSLAGRLGIETYHAGIKPEDKAAIIERLRADKAIVAMVGDGINDSPALAAADVGIAMGEGTDVAIETAGIILQKGDLEHLIEALEIGRATFYKIRENLFWALGYNIVAIPIAAGILLPRWDIALGPAFSAALMACSSLIVVVNSLQLRYRFSHHGQSN